MQEKLISYLLGDLSREEAASVERLAERDPGVADQLERLRACLGLPPADGLGGPPPGEASPEAPPTNAPLTSGDRGPCPGDETAPSGLANRTADTVSQLAIGLRDGLPTEGGAAPGDKGRCSFSMLDAGVAIGVVAAVAMMLVPALRESRESARRVNCQNQLREIGRALHAYAADHGGYFPMPPEGANAGSFTIILADNGYLDRGRLSAGVVCPGSPEADAVAQARLRVRIPTFDELEQTRGERLAELRRVMSLSFAYRSPYLCNGRLRPIRNLGSHRAPLLCDAPTLVEGQWRNVNHGCGLNVLFQDGSVRYLVDCREPVCQDHFFVNAAGQPAPPTKSDDAVLMRSQSVLRVSPAAGR